MSEQDTSAPSELHVLVGQIVAQVQGPVTITLAEDDVLKLLGCLSYLVTSGDAQAANAARALLARAAELADVTVPDFLAVRDGEEDNSTTS